MAERSLPGGRLVGLALLLVALVQLGLHGSLLARGTDFMVAALTIDDSYYYLGAAWNLQRVGFPSFDGLHPTNGVQFLWFWVLAGLAWLIPTKAAFLQAALGLGALINAACHVVIWRFARTLGNPRLALWMSGVWLLQSLGSVAYSRGLENSLHALVFWCLLWQGTEFLAEARAGRRPRWGVLTALLVLNTWSRIDAGLLSLLLYGFAVASVWRASSPGPGKRQVGRYVAVSATVAAAAGVLQLVGFRWMGGSWLPVSALIKGGLEVESWVAVALRVGRLGLPAIVPPVLVVLTLAAYAWVVLRVDRRSVPSTHPVRAWNRLWIVLLGGMVLHAIVVRAGSYWYLAPSHVFWAATLALLVHRVTEEILGESGRLRSPVPPAVAAGARRAVPALFLVGCVAVTSTIVVERGRTEPNFYALRARVGRWISENLPPTTILASWNAGQLGYFSDQPVINLDGLANSAEYYREVLRGRVSLEEYLDAEGVDYIVDRSDGIRLADREAEILLERYPEVRRFVLQKDEPRVILWRVEPRRESLGRR